jgi:16S rRNA (uracil1498-N3)-methyltransferase
VSVLPRFLAPAARGKAVVILPPDEAHHLVRVLRLRPGDGVGLFDGVGGEWLGIVLTLEPEVTVEVVDETAPAAEPPVRVTLGIGLLKGGQMDTVVRDATMLGTFAIVPLTTSHVSITRRAWRSDASARRWKRVAVASARQCRRAVVPAVAPAMSFERVFEDVQADVTLMCVEPSRARAPSAHGSGPRPESALALVGPEGGWSREEVDYALARGARLFSLGPRTLRAEAVPTVLLSSLWTQWSW